MAQIMTAKEVAEYLRLNPITIYRYASVGQIPAIKIGRKWRFDKDTIDQWIAGADTSKPGTGKAAKRKATRKPKK